MAEVNLRSWSEISQASEGLQLNSTAATLEHILARFARLETRLVEHERRVAATLPPSRPEPDPPDGPPLYAVAQPPYQPSQPPLSPYQPATTFQQPHAAQPRQYLQLQQPYQPPAPPPDALQWQQPQQPEMQDWLWQQHQPHMQPVQTRRPTSWDPPDYRQQSGFMPYDQYQLPYHHWEKNQPPPCPPCGRDPPAQRALYGCPPHNQSYHVPQPQLDPIPAYGAPSHGLPTWDYCVQQEHHAYDHQQWQDCYNQTQTEKPAAYTPPWRPESTPSVSAPVHSVAVTKFESEDGIYSYVYGDRHRMREQEGAISDSLILDAQVEYSCDDPKEFDCVSNRGMVEEEHCDNLESVLSIDSSLETKTDALAHDASGVSRPSSIALLCDNHGVEEDRDASLGNRQVPSFEEIIPLCGSDAFLLVIEKDFKVLLQGNVHDRLDILKLRKMMNSSLLKEDRDGFYVDLHISNVASMNYRLALLDADARLIPPRMDTGCLSIRGGVDKIPFLALNYHEPTLVIFDGDNEGRRSTVRYTFDPGGGASPILLLSTLLIASWIPP